MYKKILLPLCIFSLFLVSCEKAGTIKNINVDNPKYNIEKLYVTDGNFIYIVKPKDSNEVVNIIENKSDPNDKTRYPQTTALVIPKTEPKIDINNNYIIVENSDSTITLKRVN